MLAPFAKHSPNQIPALDVLQAWFVWAGVVGRALSPDTIQAPSSCARSKASGAAMHVPSLARSPRALHVVSPQVEAQLICEQRESHLIMGAQNRSAVRTMMDRKIDDARAKSALSSFSHVPNQMGCRNA